MATVWRYFFGPSTARSQATIVEALARAGVETYPLNPDMPRGLGIVIFDEITQQLCDFVQEISRNGLDRILAIATSRTVLTYGDAWLLLQAGASDIFPWDDTPNTAEDVAARFTRWEVVDHIIASPLVEQGLVGDGRVWKLALRQVVEVARCTDAPMLIMGETGTGKELVARLIHELDARPSKGDFVVLDCTTIVPELSGSEFFGHERGAFTGAVAPRDGAFALADGGTLFLDEVGELPLGLQAQLLRVVQEHMYKRVGSNTWCQTDFRLICATNRDLWQAVTQGTFRSDLYYRLAGAICKLPPLRDRVEDILPLARYFMRQLRPQEEPLALDELVRAYLLNREYPGNVRDLRQVVSRMMYRHVGAGPITVGDIPEEERPVAASGFSWYDGSLERTLRRALALGVGLKAISHAVKEAAIRIVLDDEDGNLQRAARKLGVTDRALQMRRAARRTGHITPGRDGCLCFATIVVYWL
jgi:transcriptional regulator with GAF, ATPase, and Fis domain